MSGFGQFAIWCDLFLEPEQRTSVKREALHLPVIGGLLASIPVTVITSWRRSGLLARASYMLVTPEGREPAEELRTLQPARS